MNVTADYYVDTPSNWDPQSSSVPNIVRDGIDHPFHLEDSSGQGQMPMPEFGHIQNNDIHKRLILLSSIQPGFTLNTRKRVLVYHGWTSAISQKWYAESRQKTILFVEDTLELAIRSLTSEVALLPLLKQAKPGIANLKITYEGDIEITGRIENCLSRLENACTRFERLLITSIEQIPMVLEMMQSAVDNPDSIGVRQTPTGLTPSGLTPHGYTPMGSSKVSSSIHTPLGSPTTGSPGSVTPVSSKHELNVGNLLPLTPPSTPSRVQSPNMTPPDSPPHPQNDQQDEKMDENNTEAGAEKDPIISMLDDMLLSFRVSPFVFRLNSENIRTNVRFGPSSTMLGSRSGVPYGWSRKINLPPSLKPSFKMPLFSKARPNMEDVD